MKSNVSLTVLTAVLLLALASTASAEVPALMNYQGYLTDESGEPLDTAISMIFTIYDDPDVSTVWWTETIDSVVVANGLFNVTLGYDSALSDTVFSGAIRWLGITIGSDPEIYPRTELVAVPWAFRVATVDGARGGMIDGGMEVLGNVDAGGLSIGGVPVGTSSDSYWSQSGDDIFYNLGNVGIGTMTPGEALDVQGNVHASGALISGSSITIDGTTDQITATSGRIDFDDENIVTTGKATIGPGHTNTGSNAFVAGMSNIAAAQLATVSGGSGNEASGEWGAVGGGYGNSAGGFRSTAAGGENNAADGEYATVSGGATNTASGERSTVGGGVSNVASNGHTTVGGGFINSASGLFAAIGGGAENEANDTSSAIAGGRLNTAGKRASVGGGEFNEASGEYAAIGGGQENIASGAHSMVGGGIGNKARGARSVVCGGGGAGPDSNSALGDASFIGGGWGNIVSGGFSVIGGGSLNTADGHFATISGGSYNQASGDEAIVGGGSLNKARGDFSVVGGGGGATPADSNAAIGDNSVVGGGQANVASGVGSTVAGGLSNTSSAFGATVGGGGANTASVADATVAGGLGNTAGGGYAVVGGGANNTATGDNATIAGGSYNLVEGFNSAILGGYADTISASADYSYLFGIGSRLDEDSTFMVDLPHIFLQGEIIHASEGDTVAALTAFEDGGGFVGTYGPNGNLNTALTVYGPADYNHGAVGALNADGEWRAVMYSDPYYTGDRGVVETYGPNGNINITLWNALVDENAGCLSVADAAGEYRGHFLVTDDSAGLLTLKGPNGNFNVVLRNVEDDPYRGSIGVCDDDGWMRAEMYANDGNSGILHLLDSNSYYNVYIGNMPDGYNRGQIIVCDSIGISRAGVEVNASGQGIVWGDTKSFRVANPNEPGTDIWYCCLEGPEAAAYVRGTGHLVNGRASVTLPDHFTAVASSKGITVQVTPLSGGSKGLAVVEKSTDSFAVRELNNGSGTYDFDFMVTAVRKEHEDYQVIRPAMKTQPPQLGVAPGTAPDAGPEGSGVLLKKGSQR